MSIEIFETLDGMKHILIHGRSFPFVITSIDELPISATHVLHGDGGMYP